jgi:hypothetical protein
VEARPAELALLDQTHREAQLGGAESAGVAARSGPEYEYVEVSVTHFPILALFARASARCSCPSQRVGTLCPVKLFGRGRGGDRYKRPAADAARTGSTRVRASTSEDEAHLADFVDNRDGVEGFVEPRTAVSDVTLLLVAWDGDFTRRRVPSEEWAYSFCKRRGIKAYEAGVVGIPTRMREYISRQKRRDSR